MSEDIVANFSIDNPELEAEFNLEETELDAVFKIEPTGANWGQIGGNIENQTDLQNELTEINNDLSSLQNTIDNYGDVVNYNASDFATSVQGDKADTALQPNDNISELTNDVGYITSASLPTVNNNTITIQKNGTSIGDFDLNQNTDETINITVPTTASDVGALPDTTTINDLTTTAQQNALNSGATSTNIGQIATNTSNISAINEKIPNQASSSNQLADKDFVNSSIATNTANFIGTFNSVAALEAYSGTVTNNDYAFVVGTDSDGNTVYDRYKYTTATNPPSWIFEYELNNSSFTAQQWETINSGVTSNDVALIDTALQPNDNITQLTNNAGYVASSDLATVATSGSYNDLTNKPTIPTVNDGTLTIQANGTTIGTFTANQSGNTTANIVVPDSATWGNITGDITDQTDLQTVLGLKQDVLTSDNAGTDIEITTGEGGSDTVSGVGSVTLTDAEADGLNSVTLTGKTEQTYTPEGYTRTITTAGNATAASKIDVGLLPQDGDVIEAHFKSGTAGVSFYMFQARASSGAAIYGLSGSSSGGTIALTLPGLTLTSQIGRVDGQEFFVRTSFINGNATLYVKNLTTGTEDTQTATYNVNNIAPTTNYYLWGNTVNYLNRSYPTYEVKLTNNGVTRLHYIPCTRNSDGVAGFYDLTTNTFITTATNVLTAGAVTPSPTNPLGIICNNGEIKAHNQSGIPLGYQKVEYIQTTGTQYIDTGFNIPDLTNSYRVELKMTVDGGTGDPTVSNNLGYMGQNSGLMLTYTRDYGLGIGSAGVPVTSGHIFEVVQKRNADCTRELIVDNTTFTITTQATLYADRNYGIFRLSPFDTVFNAIYGKIYEFKAYKNNVLTYNLVPCRRKSDNVLGMYDTVNKTFLTNAGTGTFSAGNDVDDFEITTDGTIETVTDESGNTATAEILCGIGNYTDTQELLSGVVTRNIGIKVLDGTESGTWITSTSGVCTKLLSDVGMTNSVTPLAGTNILSTHFIGSSYTPARSIDNGIFVASTGYLGFSTSLIGTTDEQIDAWLATQYANGTPVIVIYPLATATTETVTGQTLTSVSGDNTITITQSSIDNLPISANYDLQGGTVISFSNDTGYITSADLPTKTSDLTNDSGFITDSALSGYVESSDLATVATTGAYSDLSGTPTLGTMASESASDYTKTANLASVATSGAYSDLSGTPNLATVATSGDYDDLINKPTIDSELSTTSTNAVQNSVITQALQNIDVDTLIPVTYAELVELKTNSQLKAGAFYRMTDFVTTTNGYSPSSNEPSRSAGHPFDLIIQALGESNLSDICTAALHEGDTYFANNNLGSWQIWYDLDNSTSKYAWGDTTNGKGVIYRFIDEFGNDLSFDFKNIQFYRDNTLTKYSTIASYLTSSDNYYYVFSKNTSGTVTDKSLNANTHDNILGAYIGGSTNTRYLENTIFIHTGNTVTDTNTIGTENYNNTCCGNFYGNSIDLLFYNNVIANNFYYNNIGAVFRDNKTGENFRRNTILGIFYENTISEYFYDNEVGYNFYGNTIGNNFYGNKLCSYFYNNTIPLNSHNNFFGARFYNNTGSATEYGIQQSSFGAVVYNCTFGEKFQRNSIGNFAMNCVFGNNNTGLTIGNNNAYLTFSDNVQSSVIFNRCGYVNVTIPMVIIYSQIVGSSNTNRFTTSGLPTSGAYNITIKKDSNGAVLATYNDGANEIGYKKATVTTSAWSELLPTFTWEGS